MNENGNVVHYGTAASDFKQNVFTQEGLDFIDQSAQSRQPFFLWLTYSSPHTNGPDPNPQPPSDCEGAAKPAPRDADALASEPLPMPPNFNEPDVSDKPDDIKSLPLLTGPDIQDVARKYRCALESLLSVDRGVGRVLDALKAQGELGNTYVIYTSDNGFFNGAHRIRYAAISGQEHPFPTGGVRANGLQQIQCISVWKRHVRQDHERLHALVKQQALCLLQRRRFQHLPAFALEVPQELIAQQ